ncbi:hypothetical protein Q7P36_004028 [Cladosporium allicinum]|jgi:hypothetical protein
MQLDTVMQIVFGISASLVAGVGIWYTWHKGKSSSFALGLYPNITIGDPLLTPHPPGRNVQSQQLPYYHYHDSAAGRVLWTRRTRRAMFMEDDFGSFAMAGFARPPNAHVRQSRNDPAGSSMRLTDDD